LNKLGPLWQEGNCTLARNAHSPASQISTPAPEGAPSRRVPIWAQAAVWAGLVCLLVFVGIGLSRAQQGTVQPGVAIPDFGIGLYGGYEFVGASEIRLSDLRGKVLLVNFWASWCKPCEQEAGALEGAWKHYAPDGNVVVLGVDYVDTEPMARIFMKKFGVTYPNGPDLGTRISQLFRIKGVPETFLLDQDGVLRYVKIGPFINAEEIQSIVDPLLSQQGELP